MGRATVTAEGQNNDQAASNPSLNLESIHPNYFSTIEAPIVRGRPFTAADREGAVNVAIVSEDVASRLWPGQEPNRQAAEDGRPRLTKSLGSTIVGVAGQTRYRELRSPRPTLYLPAAQFLIGLAGAAAASPLVRGMLFGVDPIRQA